MRKTGIQPEPTRARIDARDKVTGVASYAADMTRPGMLVGSVLRSPLAHAEIVSVDVSAARRLPGVRAVLVGSDLPDVRVGRAIRDMPVLARERVRFIGEKIAAVAAESEEVAEAALDLIKFDYRELPAVFDPLEAITPRAPRLHDAAKIRDWAAPRQIVPDHPNGVTQLSWGASALDVEAALEGSERVIEHTFRTVPQHQIYLEPHTCLVEIDERGLTHVWASNKAPFLLARYLEQGLGLDPESLRIHLLPLGGDFGGKGSFMDVPLAYYLAGATGRPVRMRMSFTDEMIGGNPRHAAVVMVRSGLTSEGRIEARLVRAYFSSGAYAAFKPSPDAALPNIRVGASGPYEIPTLRVEAEVIYTNSVPSGHMRNPGEAQTTYALECHTDLVARELGIDPVELRRRNASRRPRLGPVGEEIPPRIDELLGRASAAIGWQGPRPPGIGRGLALAELGTSPGTYSAALELRPDGHVTFRTPIVENGAGMLTAFRQLVADEMRVALDLVEVEQSGSGFVVDRGVGGSRVTRITGILVTRLVRQLRSELAERLRVRLGLRSGDLAVKVDGFRLPDDRLLGLSEAARLVGSATTARITYEATDRDNMTVYGVQAAEVLVDPRTGEVRVTRIVSVHEAGRIVNRQAFEGQIEGAVIQGLGYALTEGLVIEEGRVTNVNLHEYKIPSIADVPPLETIILPADERLGITPIGEGAVGTAPAIANAIVDAVAPKPLDLPIGPEAVIDLARR